MQPAPQIQRLTRIDPLTDAPPAVGEAPSLRSPRLERIGGDVRVWITDRTVVFCWWLPDLTPEQITVERLGDRLRIEVDRTGEGRLLQRETHALRLPCPARSLGAWYADGWLEVHLRCTNSRGRPVAVLL